MKTKLTPDALVAKRDGCADVFIPALFWGSAVSFLEDWGKPLADLTPKDASRHEDELKRTLQTGLRAIVRHSVVMCGLPSEAYGEPLVGRLGAILATPGNVLPSAFYTPIWHLHAWLTRPAVELLAIEQRPGMNDAEWDAYVQRIGSGE